MATRATASVTLAWSAGIVATTRYYQLAAPTAATPTVPTSSSRLGSWTETEPAADVTKVLWTCERTVYADGTESWSKASKSTSYEAAKDAKGTATDAQAKAAALSTLIRQTDAGVEVGKSSDGKTYTTNRALMSSAGAFQVLDKDGTVLASFDEDSVDLGGTSSSIGLIGGKATISSSIQTAENGYELDTTIFSSPYLHLQSTNGYLSIGAASGGSVMTGDGKLSSVSFVDGRVSFFIMPQAAEHMAQAVTVNGICVSLMYSELLFKNWGIPMGHEIVTSGSKLSSFDFLDVVCKTNDSDQVFTRVYAPAAGITSFVVSAAGTDGASDPSMWIKSKRFKIKSEHHIDCVGNGGDTPWKRGEGILTNHISTIGMTNNDVINICEIVGWRYVTGLDGSTLH